MNQSNFNGRVPDTSSPVANEGSKRPTNVAPYARGFPGFTGRASSSLPQQGDQSVQKASKPDDNLSQGNNSFSQKSYVSSRGSDESFLSMQRVSPLLGGRQQYPKDSSSYQQQLPPTQRYPEGLPPSLGSHVSQVKSAATPVTKQQLPNSNWSQTSNMKSDLPTRGVSVSSNIPNSVQSKYPAVTPATENMSTVSAAPGLSRYPTSSSINRPQLYDTKNTNGSIPTSPQTSSLPRPGQVSHSMTNTGQQASQAKLNPAMMPRPSSIEKPCGSPRDVYKTLKSSSDVSSDNTRTPPSLVPSFITDFISIDTGAASPRFGRVTLSCLPTEKSILSQVNLPLAAVFQPFHRPAEREREPRLVDLGSNGPLRCIRCQGYANPGFRFTDGGRKFRCNLCGFVNDVPAEHFAQVDPRTGVRMEDINLRPEFYFGSVEYTATKDYCDQEPTPATFLFILDVSASSIHSGLLAVALDAIKKSLEVIPGGSKARVCIMTFDRYLYFYSPNASSGNTSVLTVPDIHEPFTPLGSQLLVTLTPEGKELFHMVLSSIATQFLPKENSADSSNNNRRTDGNTNLGTYSSEAALASAVSAAKSALELNGGGKIFLISASLSNAGLGKLEARGGGASSGGEEREKMLMKSANPLYEKLGIELSESKVSLDLFVAPTGAYIDVATIGRLAANSGGRVFHFPFFQSNKDGKNFENCLCRAVESVCAFNAVLRIRCSPGLGTAAHYGHFQPQRSLDIVIPVMDWGSTISVDLEYDDKLPEVNDGAVTGAPCIQCAVLFTNSYGERRIRVHTLLLGSSSQLVSIFRYADCDALVVHLMKKMAKMVLEEHMLMSKVREYLNERCIESLHTYRKFCTVSASSGQLILPEALKLFPLFSLGILKSNAFSLNSSISPDERAASLFRVSYLGMVETIAYVYPRLFNLSSLPDAAGVPLALPRNLPKEYIESGNILEEQEPVALPPTLGLSSDVLSPDVVLLLENGIELLVWIGEKVNSQGLIEIFGVDHIPTVEEMYDIILSNDKTEKSVGQRYLSIFRRILRQRPLLEKIRILEAKDQGTYVFVDKLVEDRTSHSMSYVEYLCYVHREIQKKFHRAIMLEEVHNYSMANHF